LRLLIADDHEAIRKGIRSILASRGDIEVCAEAANGREAIDQAVELRPDLVILDINMPVLGGFAAAQEIIRLLPDIPILFFSMHESKRMVEEAKRVSIRGFVSRDQPSTTLLEAIDILLSSKSNYFPG
jgi:DNA-binding NarL/FixJ family response regulator